MVCTENLKKSIIVVLPITILLTGTIVNIISSAAYGSVAAKTINAQTKTNQHLVTSPHIISSAVHGSVNAQTKTNQHLVTKTPRAGERAMLGCGVL
jgi:hypothetical protein